MKRFMQYLLICALALATANVAFAAKKKSAADLATEAAAAALKCDLAAIKKAWIDKHPTLTKANVALTELNKHVQTWEVTEFGYDPALGEAAKDEGLELFKNAETKFAAYMDKIASQQSRACAVCRVKKKYELAVAGGVADVTEAELLAPELEFVFANLSNLAGLKKTNESQKNATTDQKKKDDLDKAFRPIERQIDDAMTTLTDYRASNPSSPAIGAEITKMKCS